MQKFSGKGDTPLPALTPLGAYGAQAQRDASPPPKKNPSL